MSEHTKGDTQMVDIQTANELVNRFANAVRAHGYRTISEGSERDFEAARKDLLAALTGKRLTDVQPPPVDRSAVQLASCELSAGCPFGADRGDWSYHTSVIQDCSE